MEKKLIITAVLFALLTGQFAAGGEESSDLKAVQAKITQTVRKAAENAVKPAAEQPAVAVSAAVPGIRVVRTIPKPPETIKPLSQTELLNALETMTKNFELNEKEMDREKIVQTIQNFVEREKRKAVVLQEYQKAYELALKQAEEAAQAAADKPLTAEEKAEAAAQNRAKVAVSEVSLNTHEEDIETLIDGIRRAAGVNMVMDSRAIARGIADGTVRATVTLKVENMALKNALNWITRLSGLVWTLKDEAIFITTRANAVNADHKLRIYDIRDQMAPIPDFPAPDDISFGISGDPMNF